MEEATTNSPPSGAFDGVLIDGVEPSHQDFNLSSAAAKKAFDAGKAQSGVVLAAALPANAHVVANKLPRPLGYTGSMVEFFQGTNESISKLLSLPKNTLLEVHSTTRVRPNPWAQTLAAYLVVVEEGMYFGASSGEKGGWRDCGGWSDPGLLAQYRKPLGAPKGKATWTDGANETGFWAREFESGTNVTLWPGGKALAAGFQSGKKVKGRACVRWADGTTLGSACV